MRVRRLPNNTVPRRSRGLHRAWLLVLLVGGAPLLVAAEPAKSTAVLELPVRWEEPAADGKATIEQTAVRKLVPAETAILICDTWNKHWCASATRRCDELARRMAPLVEEARARGVHIIHAPSDTLDFYRDHPARKRALATAAATPPSPIGGWCSLEAEREGTLPIDDSDGGCDCQPQCKQGKAWSRQHPAIRIDDADIISDNGQEVYNYLVAHGIKNIVYMGVHTNMCVLGRSFGIRQMTRLGFHTYLVRDLTDTMYNPRMRPFVEHAAGTDLVVKHVERHWCPSTTSTALAQGLR
ncbi:MAG: isochorismatase family protein [Pirellulales bacterium]